MGQKIPQTSERLRDHLKEQVSFLCRSASSFDTGYEDEAKRLAHILRVLLHDTSQSHSLLEQLGYLKRLMFRDTAIPGFEPNHHGPVDGLTRLVVNQESAKPTSPLDDLSSAFGNRLRRFQVWWTQPVIRDNNDTIFTRRSLILNVANKDGGSHVDPELDAEYTALTVDNSMGWWTREGNSESAMPAPHLPSVRQIAHEVLSSLAHAHPEAFAECECLARYRKVDFATIPLEACNPGRNDPCPCGSGRKFKKCHYLTQLQRVVPSSSSKPEMHSVGPTSITVVRKAKSETSA